MRWRHYQRRYSRFGRRIWPSVSFFSVRLNAAKITLVFGILGILVLSVMDYSNQKITQSIKTIIVDAALPLVDLGSDVTHKVTHNIRDLFSPYKKYERQLLEKDETIQFLKLEVQRLRNEMHVLQDLLNYKKDFKVSAVTSQMFIPQGYESTHKGFLDVGLKSGIQKDSVVMSKRGVIGKVVSVGQKSAEVMLLSHPLSSVPVYVERTNAVGVIKGDVRQGIILEYVLADQLVEGDRLLTSGQGGVFPRGINIAVIEKKTTSIKIRPFHDIDTTLFVYVLSSLTENIADDANQ
jgi:rod shape-determining protein MreC